MDVAALIEAQGGLATRVFLLASGVSSAGVSRAVAAGEIVRVARGVYRRGRVDAVTRLGAATTALGGVASHDSAAALWGLDLPRPPTLHVSVPRNRSRARFPGVIVHRSEADTCDYKYGVATTSVLQTIIDCARSLPLREAVVVADSALRRALVSYSELRSLRPAGRGAARVRKVVRLADPRSESVLESLLRVLLAEHGLLPPRSQFPVRDEFGVLARVDFAWPRYRLLVEADGFEFHSDRGAYRSDRRKGNAFAKLGWSLLRFSWEDVLYDPGYVVETIRAKLAERSGTQIAA